MDNIKIKQGSGVKNKNSDNAFLKFLKARVSKNPTTSMRKLPLDMKVDPNTIRNVVHVDLPLGSYVRTPRHLMIHGMKAEGMEGPKMCCDT